MAPEEANAIANEMLSCYSQPHFDGQLEYYLEEVRSQGFVMTELETQYGCGGVVSIKAEFRQACSPLAEASLYYKVYEELGVAPTSEASGEPAKPVGLVDSFLDQCLSLGMMNKQTVSGSAPGHFFGGTPYYTYQPAKTPDPATPDPDADAGEEENAIPGHLPEVAGWERWDYQNYIEITGLIEEGNLVDYALCQWLAQQDAEAFAAQGTTWRTYYDYAVDHCPRFKKEQGTLFTRSQQGRLR